MQNKNKNMSLLCDRHQQESWCPGGVQTIILDTWESILFQIHFGIIAVTADVHREKAHSLYPKGIMSYKTKTLTIV